MDKICNKAKGTIMALILILLTVIIYFIFDTPNVLFATNIIVMILILYKAKFSYFSIKTLVFNYLLFSIFFQYNTGKSYGILQISSIPLHYFEMNLFIYIYNLITLVWIHDTKILEKEKQLLRSKPMIGTIATYFCCVIAVVTAIIAFPGMPFSQGYVENRFVGLLKGNAWNHLSIVCLLFALPNIKKSNVVKITFAFVIFWFVSHYERVDIIGLVVFVLIWILAQRDKIRLRSYLIMGSITIVVLFSMVILGEVRADNLENMEIEDILRKTLVQNTAADLGHVYNTSVEYYQNNELLHGRSYPTYMIKLIPFLDSDVRVGKILNDIYGTPGGEFILSEPLMNFGVLGLIVFQIVEFSIYYWIVSKNTKYRFFVYTFLIIAVFRTTWYGWIYIEKAVVYFIPIMYWATKLIDNTFIKKYQLDGGKKDEQAG